MIQVLPGVCVPGGGREGPCWCRGLPEITRAEIRYRVVRVALRDSEEPVLVQKKNRPPHSTAAAERARGVRQVDKPKRGTSYHAATGTAIYVCPAAPRGCVASMGISHTPGCADHRRCIALDSSRQSTGLRGRKREWGSNHGCRTEGSEFKRQRRRAGEVSPPREVRMGKNRELGCCDDGGKYKIRKTPQHRLGDSSEGGGRGRMGEREDGD